MLNFAQTNFMFKAGFVNIFGKPNAGKSTLLNALMGEKLAIVSPKVQTTRHRIKGILSSAEYQIIFSDTPGIIEPKYKLHEKMMQVVKNSLEDADVALLLMDATQDKFEQDRIFESLKLKVPTIVVVNKTDQLTAAQLEETIEFFKEKKYAKNIVLISAKNKIGLQELLEKIIDVLPQGMPYYEDDQLSDLPLRFFVGELIREKIFEFLEEEIPYQTTVLVTHFKESPKIISIKADIVVQRESQKAILLGAKAAMIKKIGTESRKMIEDYLQQKIFLELFVKVRPGWRNSDLYLKEYGY